MFIHIFTPVRFVAATVLQTVKLSGVMSLTHMAIQIAVVVEHLSTIFAGKVAVTMLQVIVIAQLSIGVKSFVTVLDQTPMLPHLVTLEKVTMQFAPCFEFSTTHLIVLTANGASQPSDHQFLSAARWFIFSREVSYSFELIFSRELSYNFERHYTML